MYAPVNLIIQPSAVLKRILYLFHAGLFMACMQSVFVIGLSAVPYIATILLIQAWLFKRLLDHNVFFLKPRQWQFEASAVRLQVDGQWRCVDIHSVRVLQSMIVLGFRFQENQNTWWASQSDILMFDACEVEAFRQARAYLRTNTQLKDNSIS